MYSPAGVLNQLAEIGVIIEVEGDRLKLTPAGKTPDGLLNVIRKIKPELMTLIQGEGGHPGKDVDITPRVPTVAADQLLPAPGNCPACHLRINITGKDRCWWSGFSRPLFSESKKCCLADSARNTIFDYPFEESGAKQKDISKPIERSIRPLDPWPAEVQAMIDWLRTAELPQEFGLHFAPQAKTPFVSVSAGAAWKENLLTELALGPGWVRAKNGVIQADLEKVWELFGPGKIKH